ncbi:MAG: low molecular weight phosphatase family protein [Clostridiales bacterium]|nr:low molecular weight phosphatase family protein [Clostridiales bacterium]
MAKAKATKRKKKIIFVCTGNTCRSPMAEYLFRYILGKKRKLSLYDIASAGLGAEEGAPMTDNALSALKRLGVTSRRKHIAKQLTYEQAEKADGIVCMTAQHKAALAALGEKVKTVGELTGGYDVPDPYGGDAQVYLKTAEYLLYACEDIFAWAEQLGYACP